MSEADTRANFLAPVLRDKRWVCSRLKRDEIGKLVDMTKGDCMCPEKLTA